MKKTTENESAFKILADRYVEQIGTELNQEATQEQITQFPFPRKKTRRKFSAGGLFAAAVIVVVILSSFLASNIIGDKNEKWGNEDPRYENQRPVLTLAGDTFTISDSMEDNGKYVYIIGDRMLDDVVVTIEKGSVDPAGMQSKNLFGQTMFYKTGTNYHILLYETEGCVITLSCRYEFDTLLALRGRLRIIL